MKISLFNESMIPVGDYYRTLNFGQFIYEFMVPAGITIISYLLIFSDIDSERLQRINGVVINFTAILVGFSVASLSILASSSSNTIDSVKKHTTKIEIGKKKISLYQLLLINFIYLLFVEFITVVFGLVHMAVDSSMSQIWRNASYQVIVFLFFHNIFLNFRNLSSFYFIFSSQGDKNPHGKEE